MSYQRGKPSLILALFAMTACAQILELDDLDFSERPDGSGGSDTAAEAGQGGSAGRSQPGAGADGGSGGDGARGIGGKGAAGTSNSAPPCISAFRDLTLVWRGSADIPFTISDPDTPNDELELNAVSDNPVLVDTFEFSGEGTMRVLKPKLRDDPEPANITVTVSDGEFQSSSTFELRVTHAPILDGLFDRGTVKNVPLHFTIGVNDDDTEFGEPVVSATSDNTALLPNDGIDIGASGALRAFTLNPALDQVGTAKITVRATDVDDNMTEGSFELTVVEAPANDAELVSRASNDGAIGNSSSYDPSLSSDGRYFAFSSGASNLVPNAGVGYGAFVGDHLAKSIRMVTSGLEPGNGTVISDHGNIVAFVTPARMVLADDDDAPDVYVVDLGTDLAELVSVAESEGLELLGGETMWPPALSFDGSFVAFSTNVPLVAEDDNDRYDIYVRDRNPGTTNRVVDTGDSFGTQVSISADGAKVVFASTARNLIDGVTDPEEFGDVFLRTDSETKRLSQNPQTLEPANADSSVPELSTDGTVVVFESMATNLIGCDENPSSDIFAYDLESNTIELVSVVSDEFPIGSQARSPAVSGDGRYVVFESLGPTLTAGYHTYIRDRMDRTTKRIDRSYSGHFAEDSYAAAISADGRFVAFTSESDNILLLDDNSSTDVFVAPRP